MEISIVVKTEGKSERHNVICHNFIQGIEDFCHDFGVNINHIVAVTVVDN